MPFLLGLLGLLLVWLLVNYWFVCAGGLIAFLLWRWVIVPARRRGASEVADRLRHERARQEIDRIAMASTEAMLDAARRESDVIEGTVEEWSA